MSGTTTIDAAGKVLSKKNENRLTAALLEFLEVLRDSNTDLNVVKQALGIGADTQEAESDKETPRITSGFSPLAGISFWESFHDFYLYSLRSFKFQSPCGD